jgi:hypothetical protein
MHDWRDVIPDGLAWNEAQLERGDPLNRGLLSLLVIKDDLHIDLIGTGFIIQSNKNHALAVSAAHCFEEVRKILHPNPLHHSSALREFLPPPSEVDLKQVKCLYFDGYKPLLCDLELAAWNQDSDYALCIVKAPPFHDLLFDHELRLDDQIPLVGDH